MPDQVITTDISNVSKGYAILGGFIVIYGLMSYVAKDRLYMSEPLIAVTLGIITGPYVLGWIDPYSWGTTEHTNYLTYELTRLVVGVQVLFTGITMPKAYLRKEAFSLFILLVIIMMIAWFVSSLLIWGLIPDLTYLESLAIGAAVTPTDPVLASSIIKGRFAERYLPVSLRNIILAESGANDGLGFPFLFLALYLLARTGEDRGTSIGTEIGRWVYGVVIYRVLLSVVYGSLVGYLAHKTLKWAETRGYIDRDNFFAYGFGLALFTLGTTGLYNSDDILACYMAGNVFTWKDWYRVRVHEEEQDSFQDIIDSLLNAAIFIYLGAVIPWADYSTGGEFLNIAPWRIVLLGISILVLRRLPWVMALYKIIPAIANPSEALFAGWFGPIGVAAVFYIQIALREIPDDGTRDRLRAVYPPVVYFCVFSSVFGHGITIPLIKLFPTIVRRTTSFSQRRTISFTSRPTKEVTSSSPSDGGAANNLAPGEKLIWNPFFAFGTGIRRTALFWRKDSIWRRENEHLREKRRVLHGDVISRPINATRQRSIDDEDNADADAQARQTSDDSSGADEIAKPKPTANIKDKQGQDNAATGASDPATNQGGNATPNKSGTTTPVAHESILKSVEQAFSNEMQRERDEARYETEHTSYGSIRPTEHEGTNNRISGNRGGIPMPQTNTTSSVPGTPGGSRVRFH